jgi:hypothetical protein
MTDDGVVSAEVNGQASVAIDGNRITMAAEGDGFVAMTATWDGATLAYCYHPLSGWYEQRLGFRLTQATRTMYEAKIKELETQLKAALDNPLARLPDVPTLTGWMRGATHDFWEGDDDIDDKDGDGAIGYVAAAVLARLNATDEVQP